MTKFTLDSIVTTTTRIPNAAIDYASYTDGDYDNVAFGYFPIGTQFKVVANVDSDGDLPVYLMVNGVPIKNRNSTCNGCYFIEKQLLFRLA